MKLHDIEHRYLPGLDKPKTPLSGIVHSLNYPDTLLIVAEEPPGKLSRAQQHGIWPTKYHVTSNFSAWNRTTDGDHRLVRVTPMDGMGTDVRSFSPDGALRRGFRKLGKIDGVRNTI